MSEPTRLPRWSVDSQTEQTQADAGGRLVDGYVVAFHTAAGHAGTVFVPRASYAPDTVRRMVDEHARLLDQVGALTSGD